MLIAGLTLAAVASLIHVYIFVLESVRWTDPKTRAIFGTTEAEAETTKTLALNQGFYNLFLAITTVVGIIYTRCDSTVGAALIFSGVGSMLAASAVLIISAPDKARSALIQGTFPALAVIALAVSIIS